MSVSPIDRGLESSGAAGNRARGLTLKLDVRARWFWVALVVLFAAWIIHSFLVPLAWASIIAIATWPIYRRFAAYLPSRMATSATPLVFTLLISSFVLAPMVFGFGAVGMQAQSWLDTLALADKTGLAAPAWLESLPWVGSWLADRWHAFLGTPGGISTIWFQRDSSALLGWLQTLGQFAAYHAFVVFFTILILFFIYRGGEEQALRLNRSLRDLMGDGAAPYLDLAIQAVRATIVGMVAVALFDGVLTGVIYAVAGVPHAAVWGAVTGLSAMIPYLAYVAVAGVAISLVASGGLAPALTVCVLGFVVHSVGDKVLRPLLVGEKVQLGFVWVLISSLGGLEVLGFIGVLIGPVALALTTSLWRQWTEDRARSSTERVVAARSDHAQLELDRVID
jgi:predicted PurR-regulated permease PerM